MIPERFRKAALTLLALTAVLPSCALALPDDDSQQIHSGDFASTEVSLDTGEFVQKAHPGKLTCLTQGSRVICGAEIRFERGKNGGLRKVTATGTPASFQVQPEADQEVAHFSGRTLVFDNEARILTIDGDAEYSQGSTGMTHEHLEYHLDPPRLVATPGSGDEGDEQGTFFFTPAATDN